MVLLTVVLGIGKTSFLRLLLDTSVVSSRTTKDQLASVAKFVQGSSGHTAHLRTASIDINNDLEGSGQYQSLGLSLIDTPSLDFKDEVTAERFLSETIRHIDGRFAEGIEDVGARILCVSLLFSFFSSGLESTDRRPLRPFVSNFSPFRSFSYNPSQQVYLLSGPGPDCSAVGSGSTCPAHSPSPYQ